MPTNFKFSSFLFLVSTVLQHGEPVTFSLLVVRIKKTTQDGRPLCRVYALSFCARASPKTPEKPNLPVNGEKKKEEEGDVRRNRVVD